jgi:hypothetical protein
MVSRCHRRTAARNQVLKSALLALGVRMDGSGRFSQRSSVLASVAARNVKPSSCSQTEGAGGG